MFKRTLSHLLLTGLIVCSSCYNNAHLRTQKILELGEKVYSGSGIMNFGGNSEYGQLNYSGISGFRGELSMLTGRESGEAGPYFGIGLVGEDNFDFIAGYEYKLYKKFNGSSPWKLGFQGEINYTPKVKYSGYGTAFHLRPSFTSTIDKDLPIYGGIHGLVSYGNLKEWLEWGEVVGEDQWGHPIYEWNEGITNYRFSSLGAGLTVGFEYLLRNTSIQLQVDVSYLSNNFITDDYKPGWVKPSQNTWLITGSMGLNLFKPPSSTKVPSKPYPVPVYEKKIQDTEPQIRYDPETGLPVEEQQTEKPQLQFDPETGLPIEKQPIKKPPLQFDPKTALPIDEESIKDTTIQIDTVTSKAITPELEFEFDPETGLPVKEKPEQKPLLQFDPKTGVLIKLKPLYEEPSAEQSLELTLSRLKIISFAKADAKRNHPKGLWTFGGGAVSCGAMALGGILGEGFAEFPGFIIGVTGAGLLFPVLISEVNTEIPATEVFNGLSVEQQTIYKNTYLEETKKLRKSSIYKGEFTVAGIACGGLLALLLLELSTY